MLPDMASLRFFRRNAGKDPKADASDTIPANPIELLEDSVEKEPSRPPLSTIQNPVSISEQEISKKRNLERTPSRNKGMLPPRTPDKLGVMRNRFGWGQRMEADLVENKEGVKGDSSAACAASSIPPIQRGPSCTYTTPKAIRGVGKTSSVNSDSSLVQSTPTKSVSKPRSVNVGSLSRGGPTACGSVSLVDTVEVPHFDLMEDSSFWMDHNVQVLVRVRPLNNMEKSSQGYSRCLRQDGAHSITWIGQPEARFTFDHVACETITQEMLFGVAGLPMVENCISGYNSCIFAYGQTGSGKTYTMLGQIDDFEGIPSPDQGMMPRIFEFLFARIRAEEESRRDENIRYNCKCSFLEIYNEQITDLLDPSSTNLMLREDTSKGVYVENLTEYEVNSVADVLKLLIEGSSNRRVAATNMNRESSRSHSVFTCAIESCWEKNSITNFRHGRLNLVDLAGSERQKTSGAEGERLKEAANINKSLSTLGHVIMVLVDVAHGKQRHIPYRDSRLTFLLQDSLGGNSKTMIIANVSPSICCSSETLSTLKFAQRAKLIQNNAVVNEDTSGDTTALQNQIRILKEEIALLKRQNVSRSLSFRANGFREDDGIHVTGSGFEETSKPEHENSAGVKGRAVSGSPIISSKKLKSLEATLIGALRREQVQESVTKKLEAEIEQLSRLVRQREEDNRGMKMLLRFREDKIQRMKSVVDGLMTPESYSVQEKNALYEEVELLRNRIDRNPEVTRFAMENIKLLEQLRSFQEFYQEGEREILLHEVSTLRDQLIPLYDGSPLLEATTNLRELESCKKSLLSCQEENEKLTREVDDLHVQLNTIKSSYRDQETMLEVLREQHIAPSSFRKGIKRRYSQSGEINAGAQVVSLQSTTDHLPWYKFNETPQQVAELMDGVVLKYATDIINLQLEMNYTKLMLEEERSSRQTAQEMLSRLGNDLDNENNRCLLANRKLQDLENELQDSKSIIEALESQHILLLKEMEDMRVQSNQYIDLLGNKEEEISCLKVQVESYRRSTQASGSELLGEGALLDHPKDDRSHFRKQLKRMQESLEEARRLNASFKSCQALDSSHEDEMDKVREQVEAETAEAIICLQEELSMVQQQFEIISAKDIETNKKLAVLETESGKLQHTVSLLEKENGKLVEIMRSKDDQTSKKLAPLELELSELRDRVSLLVRENNKLIEIIQRKDEEMKLLTEEWEQLAYELGKVLVDGNDALENASCEVDRIAQSYQKSWIFEQVEKMIKCIAEKDLQTEDLKKRLIDAQTVGHEVEWNLLSLKEATIAMNEAQQQEIDEKCQLIYFLRLLLDEKDCIIVDLENRFSERSASLELAIKELEIDAEVALERAFISDAVMCLLHDAIEKEFTVLEDSSREEGFNTPENLAVAFGNELIILNSCLQDCLQCVGDATRRHHGGSTLNANYNRLIQENCAATFSVDKEVQLASVRSNIEYGRQMLLLLRVEVIPLARQLQVHLGRLLYENEEMKKLDEQSRVNLESLSEQVLKLQDHINQRQTYYDLTLTEMCHRLESMMVAYQEAKLCWSEHKKGVSQELEFAKEVAAQKTIEAAMMFEKFDEAQSAIKEADIMVNALVKASELSKIDVDQSKKLESMLTLERDYLINENQRLKSSASFLKQDLYVLQEDFSLYINETSSIFLSFQELFTATKMPVLEDFKLMVYDICCLKSLIMKSTASSKKSLQDVWTEIIAKDCAVSILHLCHMGSLVEAITGLNAEIGFLHHGLSESNSIIANLRDHNLRAKGELETFSNLKRKLLNDIRSSFDRVSRTEQETSRFREILGVFEKKISDLQTQEDVLLARSNNMCSELGLIMKEIDDNRNKEAAYNEMILLREQEEFRSKLQESFQVQDNVKNQNHLLRELVYRHLDVLIDTLPFKSTSTLQNSILSYIEGDEVFKHLQDLMEQYSEDLLMTLSSKELEVLFFASELDQKSVANLVFCCELEEQTEEKKQMCRQLGEYETKMCELEKELEVACVLANTEENMLHTVFTESGIPKCNLISVDLCQCTSHKQNTDSTLLSGLQKSAQRTIELGKERDSLRKMLQRLKEELFLLKVEHELEKQLLVDMDLKMDISACAQSIISEELELKSKVMHIQMEKMDELNIENDMLRAKLVDVNNAKENLSGELMNLTVQHSTVTAELERKQELITLFEQKCITGDILSIKEKENSHLRHMLQRKDMLLNSTLSQTNHCLDLIKNIDTAGSETYQLLSKLLSFNFSDLTTERVVSFLDNLCKALFEFKMMSSKILMEYECIIISTQELLSENVILKDEMVRKNEVLSGLFFDLSLLQESASMAKDQEDELRETKSTLMALEEELAIKLDEIDSCSAHNQMLEANLKENISQISALELEKSNITRSFHELSNKFNEMKKKMNDLFVQKNYVENELEKKSTENEELSEQVVEMQSSLESLNIFLKDMKINLYRATEERDHLHNEVNMLKEKLEMTQALAEENEALAIEAREIAETRKAYAEDKEDEVKLLERSIEELECTIGVLENKVEMVKDEAEKQRLQTEELEEELQNLRHQTLKLQNDGLNTKLYPTANHSSDDLQRRVVDTSRLGDPKEQVELLEKAIQSRDFELEQLKVHISELTLHAEAQANEYKQKFKALETMAQEVKHEPASHGTTGGQNKSEKVSSKSRGSGSPFKCIGIGLSHQLNSEKDEELSAVRLRMEEFEALAASRQKEIFMLNTRLAAAESMTHDVIRDLLGVKLDMTNYASLLDQQKVKDITEKAGHHNGQSQEKDQEILRLRQQLDEFIEERTGWLEDINRRHAEMVAAQIACEKLRQRDQFLTVENDALKMENANQKKRVVELEGEVKKLSGQQNLKQRIHHHAKIKEESNLLKAQNEDLSAKLRHTEALLARVSDELARYRASNGKKPYVDIDGELILKNKLKETEEERVQLAQKLLSMCVNILKAAGITCPAQNISPSAAEEALIQLKDRITSTERELQDLKLKNKISEEQSRLVELRVQNSSSNLKRRDSCATPQRMSSSPSMKATK